jgi:hypothetical protein
MPFAIKSDGDKFVVYNEDTRDTKGTHDTREQAEAQLAALYLNVPDTRLEKRRTHGRNRPHLRRPASR